MAKKKKKDDASQPSDFGLTSPTGKFTSGTGRAGGQEEQDLLRQLPVPNDPSLTSAGWRGLEENDERDETSGDHVAFGDGKFRSEGELDMTPMVDVTFLLLIFFMVTASFSLMRTLPQAKPETELPSDVVVEKDEEDNLDYVEVIIDQNNSYLVTNRGEEEIEAPSDNEMRSLVKNARTDFGIEKLLITAHVDAKHSKFVTAWDAGRAANMKEIKSRTTEEEY